MSVGQLIPKDYRVYMEDNHCVIKDLRPRNQLIAKVPITNNRLFPLRIIPYMKVKTNIGATFKEENKEGDKHCDNQEKGFAEIQAAFQSEV